MNHPLGPRLGPRGAIGLLALAAVLSTGCGKHGKIEIPAEASKLWADMNHAERLIHMTEVVEPRLRKDFQAFDATRFADFGCATCHGAGAENGTYAMPNPDLPHLVEDGFFKKHRKATPDIVRFMWKEVEPNVAKALGVTYGKDGDVSCASCHLLERG